MHFSQYNALNKQRLKNVKGFTLTELLVVIFIMVILLGVGSLAFVRNNPAQGLSTASSILESSINQARLISKSSGIYTRVVINNDASDDDNYRRQILIVQDITPQDPSTSWEVTSRASYLPEGVYLDDTLSVTTISGLGATAVSSASIKKYPGGSTPSYVYIQFNALGLCTLDDKDAKETTNVPGAQLSIISGALSGGTLINKKDQKAALVVWKNGSVTRVEDPTKIN